MEGQGLKKRRTLFATSGKLANLISLCIYLERRNATNMGGDDSAR